MPALGFSRFLEKVYFILSSECKKIRGQKFNIKGILLKNIDFCVMLSKLQKRWNASPLQILLILVSFALGGSLCGYTARLILGAMPKIHEIVWIVLYILIATLIWPLCVLIIGSMLGQFTFFRDFLLKLKVRILGQKTGSELKPKIHLAIFASGAGSNALKLIERFASHEHIHIRMIVCNKPGAGVLEIADANGIPHILIQKDRWNNGDHYISTLQENDVTHIILAGFLWKVPGGVIKAYRGKILNIHPALLPKYGGKGMYGNHVHEAVIAAGDSESGITIHEVDEIYDHGKVVFQKTCDVDQSDTAEMLAKKVHALEHRYFGEVVEGFVI